MNAQSIQNQEETLFNSGFISITIINFIVFLVYYCFVVITASYATKELHSTVAEAGFATGIYIIGTLSAVKKYFGTEPYFIFSLPLRISLPKIF